MLLSDGSEYRIGCRHDHCLEFFEAFPDALKVVDPVMGDGGKAYKTYTKELCSRMVELAVFHTCAE